MSCRRRPQNELNVRIDVGEFRHKVAKILTYAKYSIRMALRRWFADHWSGINGYAPLSCLQRRCVALLIGINVWHNSPDQGSRSDDTVNEREPSNGHHQATDYPEQIYDDLRSHALIVQQIEMVRKYIYEEPTEANRTNRQHREQAALDKCWERIVDFRRDANLSLLKKDQLLVDLA